MKRRDFLTTTAAGAAAIAGAGLSGLAQGGAPAPPPAQAPPAGRGGFSPLGQPGQPANVPAHKLARISLMQLNFGGVLIPQPSANNPNPTPTPQQTLTIFDLPRVYVETLRRPQHRIPARERPEVGDRTRLHQGAQGQARRIQDDDVADQHGDRRHDRHDRRCRGAASGHRSPEEVDRHRQPVRLQAPDAQPESGDAPRRSARPTRLRT